MQLGRRARGERERYTHTDTHTHTHTNARAAWCATATETNSRVKRAHPVASSICQSPVYRERERERAGLKWRLMIPLANCLGSNDNAYLILNARNNSSRQWRFFSFVKFKIQFHGEKQRKFPEKNFQASRPIE
jgi:hypothetical protein